MDQLTRSLEEIVELNKDPNLAEKLKYALTLSHGLQHYVEEESSKPTELQKKIHQDTLTENWKQVYENGLVPTFRYVPSLGMITDGYEATFLRLMAQVTNAERILEIGMFTGHSAVSFAAPKTVKEVICLENEKYFETFLKERIKGTELDKKIHVRIGSALESLEKLKVENVQPFDIVFIDADKSSYKTYYQFVMDNGLIKPRGIFLIDNVLWNGTAIPGLQTNELGKKTHEFNEFVSQDPRVDQVMLPIRDGVTMIVLKE